MGISSSFKQITCLLISWSLMVSPVYAATGASAAAPQPKTADPAKLQRNLTAYFATLKAARADIDRSSFDLDALLDKLDHDEKNIIRFVQQEIAVELYPGVLRGAKGTLMSWSGNALDQSLLLATLLKNAGLDARILRGELNDEWAKKLVDSLRSVKAAELSAGEREKIQRRFVDFARASTSPHPGEGGCPANRCVAL